MQSDTRLLVAVATALAAMLLSSPESANAGTRLYTGSIQLRVSSGWASTNYEIPFGASFSYPSLNNLPLGDSASVSGSAPAAFAIDPNQMILQTSVSTSALPASWTSLTFAASSFSGGHAAGGFDASGAPGNATSAPLSSLPASRFGISFSGTPTRFGGTMQLLGSHHTRYGTAFLNPNGHIWCESCAVVLRPLAAIGGSFGGSETDTTWINGTASPVTFFDATVWGFPWTTGTVSAMAPAFTRPDSAPTTTTLTAMGTDQRTPQGSGEIQLVSPFVVRHRYDFSSYAPFFTHRAGIAIASLHFVPEPSAALQLAGGLSALAALYVFSQRRK